MTHFSCKTSFKLMQDSGNLFILSVLSPDEQRPAFKDMKARAGAVRALREVSAQCGGQTPEALRENGSSW